MYKFQTKSFPSFALVHSLFGNSHQTCCNNNQFSGSTAPFSQSGTAPACLERRKLIWKEMLEIKSLWIDKKDTCWMDVELQSAGSLPCLSFQAVSLHQLWKGWERASLQRSSAAWEWWGKWSRWQEWWKWKRFLLYHFNFSGCILNLTEETAFGEHWLDSQRLLNRVLKEKNNLAIAHISFDHHDQRTFFKPVPLLT